MSTFNDVGIENVVRALEVRAEEAMEKEEVRKERMSLGWLAKGQGCDESE